MSNELVSKAANGGLAALMDPVNNPFLQDAAEQGVRGGAYLRFNGNNGQWVTIGQQSVDDGSLWAMNLLHAERGYQCWSEGKLIDEVWVSIMSRQSLPALSELRHVEKKKESDGWKMAVKVPVRAVDGGPQCDMVMKADNPNRPINRLLKEFGQQLALNMDPATKMPKVPVIELGSESFVVKGVGTKFSPKFRIVEWRTEKELAELDANAEPSIEEKVAASVVSTYKVGSDDPLPPSTRTVGKRL